MGGHPLPSFACLQENQFMRYKIFQKQVQLTYQQWKDQGEGGKKHDKKNK